MEKSKKGNKRIYLVAAIVTCLVVLLVVLLAVLLTKDTEDTKNNNVNKEFVVIKTKAGEIQGKIHHVVKYDNTSATVYEYRNVPYANAPVGNLRWRPPVALNETTSWKGVLKYTSKEIWCKQKLRGKEIGTEDCLILSVRQPSHANKTNQLPVLFWIHGGGLAYGSSYWYYPAEECTTSLNMVTVSINYRLDAFGFLSIKEMWTSTRDKEYGNFGIMDMILALKWVKENIEDFGGNPDKVTIIGESGGGAAVNSLLVSPAAKGLFHKAITASGYPVTPEKDFNYANKRYGDLFKRDTKCNKSTSDEVMQCLRDLPSDVIVKNLPGFKHPLNKRFSPWIFPFNEPVPAYPLRVIDGKVIPKTLGHLTQMHTPGMKILIGNTASEGNPAPEASTWEGFYKYLEPRIDSFAKNLLNTTLLPLYKERRRDKTSPSIMTPQYIHQMMLSDVLLACQTNEVAKNLSSISDVKVYRYVVSQPFSFNQWDKNPPYAYHGIDTDALFGFNYRHYLDRKIKLTTDDLKLIKNMRQMVKDFVYNETSFEQNYMSKTIDLWNNKILALDSPYHEKECKVLRENGFLRRSWGQLNN